MGATCREAEPASAPGRGEEEVKRGVRISGYGWEFGPTCTRRSFVQRERGPRTADTLRSVCRPGGTSAPGHPFHHIQPLSHSFGCVAEGQSDPAEEELGSTDYDPTAGL